MSTDGHAKSRPFEAFEARDSIWSLIEGNTIDEEQAEIKKVIGSSLIEETVDLHREVKFHVKKENRNDLQ